MMEKTCTKCYELKSVSFFYPQKTGKFGFTSACKKCYLIHQKTYNDTIKSKRKEYSKGYYINNKENINSRNKKYYLNNKEKAYEYAKKYRAENAERTASVKRVYYDRNKKRIRYVANTHEKYRLANDPIFRLRKYFRNRVSSIFKEVGIKKRASSAKILGVSYETAKKHLERQFKKGMSWDNHGEWHIDHIIPLSSARTEEDLITLCHYSNLQPLWAKENLQKRNQIPQVQIKLII